MNHRTLRIPVSPDVLACAAAIMKRGGVIAIPTDTLYGLAADPFNPTAVQRVLDVKGRPQAMGIPLLLAGLEQLALVSTGLPPAANALAERFWPGALTLVVRRSPNVSDAVTGGRDTVAVRVPDHPVPRQLARDLGQPITGTSANRTGMSPALTAEEAAAQLGNGVNMVLDGGRVGQGLPSTIVDVTGQQPVLIREGAIPFAEVLTVWRKAEATMASSASQSKAR